MKKLIYLYTLIIAVAFTSCSEEVTVTDLTESSTLLTAPLLSSASATNFVVTQTTQNAVGNENEDALTLSWSVAESTSSEAVTYFVQMDISGNKFANPVTIPLKDNGTTELSKAITFGSLNKASNLVNNTLLANASPLSVSFSEENTFEIRIEAVLGSNIAKTFSEPVAITVTPYFSGLVNEIIISGNALASDVNLTSNAGIYEGRVKFTKDETFKFYASPMADGITYNYTYFTENGYTINSLFENAGDADNNFKFVGETGTWDIVVNSNEKTIELSEVIIPDNLFMVGSHNGWNNADATQQFNNDGNGIFTKVQAFDAGAEFKLLPTSGSWDGDWGESKTAPGTIVQDDENNIKVENAGTYLVQIDFNTLTYKLYNITSLFMVGSHNSWNNADATQEFYTSGNGIFTRVQTFDAGAEFKLLPTSGSWDGDWGVSKTTAGTIVQDGEDNIKVENAGTYMVTVNFNNFTYNLTEIPNALYLVGSPNGWNNATAPAFTKLSEGKFEISQALTSSDEFKFLPQQGAWDNDWGKSKVYDGMLVRENEDNVKSPGDGTYTITVDFNKGMYTVE